LKIEISAIVNVSLLNPSIFQTSFSPSPFGVKNLGKAKIEKTYVTVSHPFVSFIY
jgi:hypothetical protein